MEWNNIKFLILQLFLIFNFSTNQRKKNPAEIRNKKMLKEQWQEKEGNEHSIDIFSSFLFIPPLDVFLFILPLSILAELLALFLFRQTFGDEKLKHFDQN